MRLWQDVFLGGALCLLAGPSFADGFNANFDYAFSGASPGASNVSWVHLSFETVAPGTVTMSVSNLNLVSSENVDKLYVNLNPGFSATSLLFSSPVSFGAFDLPTISRGANAFKADGDGYYDVLLDFATAGTDQNRFNQGDALTFTISGIPSLSAADFEYLSAPGGGSGPFYAAAHVQRIGNSSGWIAVQNFASFVPEPRCGAIFGLGLICMWVRRRFGVATTGP